MKKFSLVALIALGSVLYAGPMVKNNQVVDIKWSSFSDGMHLEINHATGLVTGYRTGGSVEGTPLRGHVGSNNKYGLAVTVATQHGDDTGCLIFQIDDNPKMVRLKTCDGSLSQSSAYTVGTPALAPESTTEAVSGE